MKSKNKKEKRFSVMKSSDYTMKHLIPPSVSAIVIAATGKDTKFW
jgi:hypothetical protein